MNPHCSSVLERKKESKWAREKWKSAKNFSIYTFSTQVYFLKAHFSVDFVNDCKIKDTESKTTVLPEYRVLLEK